MKLAKDIMTKHVIATKPHALARHALVQILIGQYSGMPVINEQSEVVGVVSEFDLVKTIHKNASLDKVTIEDIMTKSPLTVDVSEPIEKVIDIMIEKGYLRIPVTENGKLVGVISRSDILRSYYDSQPIRTIY